MKAILQNKNLVTAMIYHREDVAVSSVGEREREREGKRGKETEICVCAFGFSSSSPFFLGFLCLQKT